MVIYLGYLFSRAVGRQEHWKQISLACVGSAGSVWAALGLPRSQHVRFPSLHCSGPRLLAGELSKAGAGLRALPRSKPLRFRSRVLHQGADSVGPAFCALPRSQQLRRPGAWKARSLLVGTVSSRLPRPRRWVSWVAACAPGSGVPCVFWGVDRWL